MGELTTDRLAKMLLDLGKSPSTSRKIKITKEMLSLLKRTKTRRPDLVLAHGGALINTNLSQLGNDAWDMLEDVTLAALDMGDVKRAQECIEALEKKFGNESARVARLNGMLNEYQGKFGVALTIYTDLLEKNPSNQLVKKRLVSIYHASGDTQRAIKELVEHLCLCQTDVSGWQQLAKLYLEVNCFRYASFCYEELIASNPKDSLYHMAYAELAYTHGREDAASLKLARQYFAQALDLKPTQNNRSLIGMAMSAAAVKTIGGRSKGHNKSEEAALNAKVHTYAAERLEKAYSGENEAPTSKYVRAVLARQKKIFSS